MGCEDDIYSIPTLLSSQTALLSFESAAPPSAMGAIWLGHAVVVVSAVGLRCLFFFFRVLSLNIRLESLLYSATWDARPRCVSTRNACGFWGAIACFYIQWVSLLYVR